MNCNSMWTRNVERQKFRAVERDLTYSFIRYNTGNFNYVHLEFMHKTSQHLLPSFLTLKP